MTQIASGGGGGRLPRPPKPKASLSTGGNPRGVAIAAPKPAYRPPPRRASAPPSHTDASSGYGSQRANRYKATPHYANAVKQVFNAQPLKQKAAIVRGAARNAQADPYTAKAVRDAFHSLPIYEKTTLAKYLPHNTGLSPGQLVGKLGHIFSPGTVYGSSGKTGQNSIAGTVTPFEKGTFGRAMAINTGKDLVNLPAEAFSTVGTLGSDVINHDAGKALSDITSPFVQLAKHPLKTVVNHPLDTYLMVAGALHGATRPVAGAARAVAPADSAFGRMVARERPGINLTGQLTHERPPYSQFPLIQAAQRLADRAKLRKVDGSVVTRRQELQDKLTALETSRETQMTERVRRANRDAVHARRLESVRPSRAVRLAQQTGRALKKGRKASTIAGADALSLIPDATIRSARTMADDIRTYVKMVSANRANLLDRPDLLKEHDATVAKLNDLANRIDAGKVDKQALFKASNSYAKDYTPVQNTAAKFGQFGERSKEALDQRMLAHYAITHMGAKYDPELEALTIDGARISNGKIRADMRANGVKHDLAFTSDKPHPDSAFYVSSDRRPLPESARNTYFAYTHGLTDTSHESLLRQHVRMQGVIDAHKAQNRLLEQVAVQKPGGGYWSTYKEAQAAVRGRNYVPVRIGQAFHPQAALDQALEGVHPAALDEEAALHGLDLSNRLKDSGPGKYALISRVARDRIEEHKSAITPQLGQRAFTSANNQFRRVALSTSAKHVPGVASEQVIRDIASGTGLSSWITGHRILNRLEKTGNEEVANVKTRLKGGQLAGATQMATRHFVAERYQGTSLYPWMKRFERFMENPGVRHLATAWRAWTTFAIGATKHVLEEQHQVADIGKSALIDFSSEHGPFFKALRIQGEMLDDAARGLFDPAKQRQFRVYTERIRGRWNDLTPHGQMALMYSPFGLWWINSVRWLARAPIDQPVKTGLLAAATVGTEKERQAHGLDLFSAGRLPDYMQGGIPIGGGRILAQNYYSPFGVANEPFATASSLVEPWATTPLVLSPLGIDWKGTPINSPGDPHGRKGGNTGQRIGVALNSILASFIPLYTKAEQIAEGGASAYDTSGLATGIQTKQPGKGPAAGLTKALTPYRSYAIPAPKTSGSGGWGGGGSSSGGWGSSASGGGWG
jgi:hypothetical protein